MGWGSNEEADPVDLGIDLGGAVVDRAEDDGGLAALLCFAPEVGGMRVLGVGAAILVAVPAVDLAERRQELATVTMGNKTMQISKLTWPQSLSAQKWCSSWSFLVMRFLVGGGVSFSSSGS